LRRAWRAWREGGEEALAAKPRGGGKRKLTDRRLDELVELSIAGPPAAGFPTDLRTSARFVELIRERLGVEYDRRRLAKLLRQLGFRTQKPRTVAREQDSAALERQRRQDGPRIKKARRRGVSNVCLDATGLLRQPVKRRTWAPVGCAPAQRSWDRRDRLSVPGAAILSPAGTRVGCCFDVQRRNVQADDGVACLRRLRRKVRRPLRVVRDRWSVHWSAEKRIARLEWKRSDVEQLPAYCRVFNPAEATWSHAKSADLASFAPNRRRPTR
jgi:transposase